MDPEIIIYNTTVDNTASYKSINLFIFLNNVEYFWLKKKAFLRKKRELHLLIV